MRCDRCGRTAEGFAMIGDRRYCHPDYGTAATCYEQAQWGERHYVQVLVTHHLLSVTAHGRWVCACGRRGPRTVGGEVAARLWRLHTGWRSDGQGVEG